MLYLHSAKENIGGGFQQIGKPSAGRKHSAQNDSKYNDDQDYGQDQQQTACFVPRRFLVPAGTPQLHVGAPGVLQSVLNIDIDRVQHVALLSHDVSHVAEQLVQFTDGLFNLPYLAFAFYDQVLLEVDFALFG